MANKDKVQFLLGNESHDGRISEVQDYSAHLKSYSLKYDLFAGAASFDASLDIKIDIKLAEKPLRFFWKINDIDMMTGYVDKKDLSYSKGYFQQTVSGRDMMQVLLDNYVLTHDPYEDKTLQYIINDVYTKSSSLSKIENLNGTKSVTKNITPPLTIPRLVFNYSTEAVRISTKLGTFKHIKTSVGQTLFDFVSSLCNQIGLYLYNVPGTSTILIHAVTPPSKGLQSLGFKSYDRDGLITKDPPYPFYNQLDNRASNNIIGCSFSENITSFHKFNKLVGQAEKDNSIAGKYYSSITGTSSVALKIEKIEGVDEGAVTAITKANIDSGYSGVTKFAVSNINEADLNTWSTTKDQIINNILLQQNRALYNLRVTVANHSPDNSSDPYFINHSAVIYDDFIGIYGAGFLVYGVDYKGSKDGGFTTELTLCLPSAEVPGLFKESAARKELTGKLTETSR